MPSARLPGALPPRLQPLRATPPAVTTVAASLKALRGTTPCRFERRCIAQWLAEHGSCPVTRVRVLPPFVTIPNYALRSAIEQWARQHAPWLLVSSALCTAR